MKKLCLAVIVCSMFALTSCASQNEMQDFYASVYSEPSATLAALPTPETTPEPLPKTSREQGLALVSGFDLGDTNINDTKVNFVIENNKDTVFKYSGDIYEYGVSQNTGKLVIINRKKVPEDFSVANMLSQEDILPLARGYVGKLVPDFNLATMNEKVKPYKLGKGDDTDPLRTNYLVDFITLKSNIDINHRVTLEFDQNGNFTLLEASYNPDFTVDETLATIPYEDALKIAEDALKEFDAENFTTYAISPSSNDFLTLYGDNNDKIVWELKFNNDKLKYCTVVIDALSKEILETSGRN